MCVCVCVCECVCICVFECVWSPKKKSCFVLKIKI